MGSVESRVLPDCRLQDRSIDLASHTSGAPGNAPLVPILSPLFEHGDGRLSNYTNLESTS